MRIVLLPGLDGTGLLFEPLCRAFSSSVQATVFDYPCERETSCDELAAQLRAKLPTTEPFILLGESYGGPLSLKLAAERPRGLCGLILSASFITCPHSYVPRWSSRLIVPAMFYPAPLLSKLKALVGRDSTPEVHALVNKALARVAPAVMAARVKEVATIDVTNELLACPVPILYIQATQDYVVPSNNLEKIQRVRADVKAVRIEAPHMVLQARAAAAAEDIERFANEQSTN
ncbi:MAG: pimeloyl-[acyl-carrier protein] methyl ester esterase [Gammaproteobacteria bacterium]|jgi:pimeloyl-[acyl-carrier protein] methyl ester esterase